ncbi:phytoene/squalene synthase family protein [Halorhodospira halochloris]|uniref:Phytoene synthase n=1 Tax=Halorhodospira halochloris TaxID=1052 RepID=A0A110B4X5_HALHR|nr:phytoene/squalene synthase family protein [Halorhodospira halochloris]MBK1651431.1 phytoene synthase [Halorhodospira halochloris]MCG5530221.1 phytoene/squalene synthase family protein [Halorhodospira halochloris]BAU57310.1 phytoene synthase [Halorhodospira halochloris]
MLAPSPDPRLAPQEQLSAEDRNACRALLATGSKTFFASSWLLPRDLRDPATALYAFCRLADDAVDHGDGGVDVLDDLDRRLDAVYAGDPFDYHADRAFAWAVHHYRIPRALPGALIEGFSWDAKGWHCDSLDDLFAYAVRVAGTVGLMMSLLMRVRDPQVLARACDLGVAMQLTNIVRDVGEDARSDRIYLPRQWLSQAGVEPERLLAQPEYTPQLGRVVQRLLKHADMLYERSMAGVQELPWRARGGICAARLLYAEIGREVERRGLDSVNQRAVVPARRKAAVLLRVVPELAAYHRGLAVPPLEQARALIESVESCCPDPALAPTAR